MCGLIRRDMSRDEDIQDKVEMTFVTDKMWK